VAYWAIKAPLRVAFATSLVSTFNYTLRKRRPTEKFLSEIAPYFCGLRVAEALKLRVKDVDVAGRKLKLLNAMGGE
jgi:integrase